MDKAFFRSKYFVISAILAVLVLGGAFAAAYVAGDTFDFENGCDTPRFQGAPLDVSPGHAIERDGRERTTTFRFNASAYTGGALDACIGVGEILIEPTTGESIELSFRTKGGSARAVEGTDVRAQFHLHDGRLTVYAWQPVVGRTVSVLGTTSTDTILVVRLPDTGAYAIAAETDVGEARVTGLMASSLQVRVGVGNAHATKMDLMGDAGVHAGVGNALLEAASVQSARIEVEASVGDAEVLLPKRADVGYDARGAASVGSVEIQLGEAEDYDSSSSGAGEIESARTAGYDAKPTRVIVRADANVGDVRIIASGGDAQ